MAVPDPPRSEDDLDLMRKLDEIAVKKVREFVLRFHELVEYERSLAESDEPVLGAGDPKNRLTK